MANDHFIQSPKGSYFKKMIVAGGTGIGDGMAHFHSNEDSHY